ncbi:MAG: hypothetical protein PHF86_12805 [Candidatus Nanoarchaeia archaeon]|nr:hypothetical protein [Candidatus Nanoarchaeia archaeon]
MKDIPSNENGKTESHRFANLCYLTSMATKSGKGKSEDVLITEHKILKKWCELVGLESGIFLDQVIKYFQDKVEYQKAQDIITENTLLQHQQRGIEELVETNELSLNPKEVNEAIKFIKEYKNKPNQQEIDSSLKEILEKHRYDLDSAAVPLNNNQIKELFEVADTNLRIDQEESDLLGYIIRMNNLPNAVQESRDIANKFLKRYSQDKSLLLCLSEKDSQKKEIIEQLKTLGYKIGLLNPLVNVCPLMDGNQFNPDKTGSDENTFNLYITEFGDIEAEKGFKPNMLIIDPKSIIDQIPNYNAKRDISYIKDELRKVCMSFENLGKDIPIIVYGKQEDIETFKDMSLNIRTLTRENINVLDLNSGQEKTEIQKLQGQINNIYELHERNKAL